MREAALADTLLTRLGYAVFEDAGAGELTLVGPPPDWFSRAFGEATAAGGRFVPGDSSPFLENFLAEAQKAWSGAIERAESGEWIEVGEDGRELALEAEAFLLADRRILLVANLQARFDEKSRMLQLARVDKLAHERLLREIQTKEILLHCIIHDLSQPLTALKGCLSLLGMNLPPEKMREVVDIADRQTRKQEGMIRDVLKAFASEMQAAAGATSADQSVDVAQAAREVVTEYAAAYASQGAALVLDSRLDAPGRDWHAAGEHERLRRMFTNYLENALRYSPAGTVTTVGVEEDAGFLRAFVDDQGPGLPEGVTAANLFRLFGKGKESKGKAGLGLYFCKITAERWGGSVGCENRAAGGTRFWFRLPRPHRADESEAAQVPKSSSTRDGIAPVAQSPNDPDEAKAPAGGQVAGGGATASSSSAHPLATGPAAEAQTRRKLRILLADDVEINRTIAAELLESRGHEVTLADDGGPAVDAFRARPFDVVLLDIEMTQMGGLEAARAMRQIEQTRGKRARILAMTAHTTQQDRENCYAAGMDGRVLKPFEAETLCQQVEEGTGAPPQPPPPSLSVEQSGADAGLSAFREQLLARCSGDAALVARIARMFLKDSPRLLAAVQEAASASDPAELASAAHALKGAVAHFGAQQAREAARRVEDMARRGELDGLTAALASLQAAVQALRTELASLSEAKAAGHHGPRRPEARGDGKK